MKKALVCFLLVLALCVPVFAAADNWTDDTVYQVRFPDTDRITDGGFFTMEMYGLSVANENWILNIRPGDKVTFVGQEVTAKEVIPQGDGVYELRIEEDTFETVIFKRLVQTIYSIMLDDCQACGSEGTLEVTLPLDDDFTFIWEGAEEEDNVTYTADEFIAFLAGEEGKQFNQYNTSVKLRNGRPIEITHRDYPAGLDFGE